MIILRAQQLTATGSTGRIPHRGIRNNMEQTNGMEFFLCVLGLVFIVEGLPYFAFPAQIKQYLVKLLEIPDRTLRILGLGAIITGLLLVYFGRR